MIHPPAVAGKRRRLAVNLLVLSVATVLSLLAAEAGLRLAGHRPWQQIVHDNEPTAHEPDPVLGWRNKAGDYEFPNYRPGRRNIRMTFFPDGRRATDERPYGAEDDRPKLVIVGGSFTQGWAISDRLTYPWKLQKALPAFEVLSYGTGAYGTYQSWLALERALPTLDDPRVVLYGFMPHHESRNVGPASWLEALSKYAKRSHVSLPYASLGPDGELVRHPPEAHPALPLRDHLALVPLLEKALMKLRDRGRKAQARPVTQAILVRMNALSARHGARFVVVLLNANERLEKHYLEFLDDNAILALDCAFELTPDMRVKGEGHPNRKMNIRWTKCISQGLQNLGLTRPLQQRPAGPATIPSS